MTKQMEVRVNIKTQRQNFACTLALKFVSLFLKLCVLQNASKYARITAQLLHVTQIFKSGNFKINYCPMSERLTSW